MSRLPENSARNGGGADSIPAKNARREADKSPLTRYSQASMSETFLYHTLPDQPAHGGLMSLMDILGQYAGFTQPQADTHAHFDEVASQAAPASLGAALASMFRSNSAQPFGQAVGSLFQQSNPQQRAGVVNQIAQALGPAALGAGGGVLGRLLGNSIPVNSSPNITPQQATQLSPAEVGGLATHAEQQNPSIVDKLGAFYSQHPALIKTLGAAALAITMGHMQRQQRS